MKRFLVDNQLPAALVPWCEAKGCQADHVLSLQMAQSPDDWIWHHAARSGAIIITKDEDFAQMTVLRPESVAVVWLRFGNCRKPALLAKLEQAWPHIIAELDAGVRLVEVQ